MLDFGFGFWILFFFVFFGCGKMCGWGAKIYRNRDRDLEEGEESRRDRLSRLESRVRERDERARLRPTPMISRGGRRGPEPSRAERRQKTPLQDLQERFIEGRLTLSEYERELDRLERIE